ncbi:MAG: RNA pyrophosphohydrolase [Alphaproteobacteria bacterium]
MTAAAQSALYRAGVGIVLLNRDGKVWVGERIDAPGRWQLPQGGMIEGEDPVSAALRELREETGVASVELLAESRDWLSYDLPADIARRMWGGRYRGQRQKWFLFRFVGGDREIDLGAHTCEFSAWRWTDFDALPGLAIAFKRKLYEALVREFGALAKQRNRGADS